MKIQPKMRGTRRALEARTMIMRSTADNTANLLINILGAEAATKLMQAKGIAGCVIEIPKGSIGHGTSLRH